MPVAPVLLAKVTIKLPPEVAIPLAIGGLVVLALALYWLLLRSLVHATPSPQSRLRRLIAAAIFLLLGGAGVAYAFPSIADRNLELAGIAGLALIIGCYLLAAGRQLILGALLGLLGGAALIAKPILLPVVHVFSERVGTHFGPGCDPSVGCIEYIEVPKAYSLDSEAHYYFLIPGMIMLAMAAALLVVRLLAGRAQASRASGTGQ